MVEYLLQFEYLHGLQVPGWAFLASCKCYPLNIGPGPLPAVLLESLEGLGLRPEQIRECVCLRLLRIDYDAVPDLYSCG